MSRAPAVIWHDLECGAYREDLPLWRRMASAAGGRVLDIGAGTGRVSLDLARSGHEVIALDRDAQLLDALRARADADGHPVTTVLADAREFSLPAPVALCIVPMQTVQLLSDAPARRAMLGCARAALGDGGRLAFAVAEALEPFEVAAGAAAPLPDVGEFDGTVYSSRPLAIRAVAGGWVLERVRETVSPAGELSCEPDRIRLAELPADRLEAEAAAVGFTVAARETIATTDEYVGSTVVVLDV